MSDLLDLITGGRTPLIGMIQLPPLAGSSRYVGSSITDIIAHALRDAAILDAAGFDAFMVQNLSDLPVDHAVAPAQVAWMTRVAEEVRRAHGRPLGLNFLENDAGAMFAVASAAGIDFVRVKTYVGATVGHNGIDEAQAYHAIKARNAYHCAHVAILADVYDRTSTALAPAAFAEACHSAVALGGADALVLTGRTQDESVELLTAARDAVAVPLVAGGGVTAATLARFTERADAVIVSSALKSNDTLFGSLDAAKASAFVRASS